MKFGRRDSLFASPPEDEPSNGHAEPVQTLPVPASRPAARASANQPTAQLNAFLGTGCIYEGKLTFEGRVRIDGKFTGEIFSNETLEIGPDAEIEAEIDVSTLIIAGRVTGNIQARQRCDLRSPGVVVGNITSPVITMEEGVQFDGEIRMSTALDSALRAGTVISPSALEPPEDSLDELPPRRVGGSITDPSELLKPVP